MFDSHLSDENAVLSAARAYVEDVLQAPLDIGAAVDGSHLPGFLAQRYMVIEAHLLNRPCILMIPRFATEDTPAIIAKHRDLIRRQFHPATIILVTRRVSAHNRKRLIAHRMPFIVPGNQLFVPELAMDLREHFRSEQTLPAQALSPTAQLLVIAALQEPFADRFPSALAVNLGVSAMSMSRAVDELVAVNLIQTNVSGRHRIVSFPARHELWAGARPLLRSPVRKRRRIPYPAGHPGFYLAGESALAERTELSEPRIETRAIAASEWKSLANRFDLDRPPEWNEPVLELETWSYDPGRLADGNIVDPLSLWLSLSDTSDERFAAAKDDLLGQLGL